MQGLLLVAATIAAVFLIQPKRADGNGDEFRVIPAGGTGGVEMTSTLDRIFEAAGAAHGINPRLLKAIAMTESSLNPEAVNQSDPSYGLMQILCVPDGNGGCSNRFNVRGWPPGSKTDLYDPNYNVKIGAQILDWNLAQYGFPKGVAVYNNWSARNDPRDGPFRNQNYVDKVLGYFENYGGGNARDTSAKL